MVEKNFRLMKLLEEIGLLNLKHVDNIYNFKKVEFSKNLKKRSKKITNFIRWLPDDAN